MSLQLIPKPQPWMPASAGMTGMATWGVIPAQAGIQSLGEKEVLGQIVASPDKKTAHFAKLAMGAKVRI
ncbi:MAG TPA: hypothetical protein VGX03_19440 [Candidatus Binatia bacterium]|nr:hypothetical protein [Candidatus Binatia bacterium]